MSYNALSYINFFSNMSISFNTDDKKGGIDDALRLELNKYWFQGSYIDGKTFLLTSDSEQNNYSSVIFHTLKSAENNPTKKIECVRLSPNFHSPKWESS